MKCIICQGSIRSLNVISLENIEHDEGSRLLRIAFRKSKKIYLNDKTNFNFKKGTAFMIKGKALKEFTGFGYKGYKCLQICQDCAIDVLTEQHMPHKLLREARNDQSSSLGVRNIHSTRGKNLNKFPPPTPELVQHQTEKEEITNHISTTLHHFVNENKAGAFVIFENPEKEKFVQFLLLKNEFLCDIPIAELTAEEDHGLKSLIFKDDNGAFNEKSYMTWFNVDEIDRATELTERIFLDIFNIQRSSTITSEIFP